MDPEHDHSSAAALSVQATHCRRCTSTVWPPQLFGCERCGAHGDDLEVVEVPAHGTVHSFATVRSHPTVPVPFTVLEVLLDKGLLIRAVCDTNQVPAIGIEVHAVGRGAGDRLLFAAVDREQTAAP